MSNGRGIRRQGMREAETPLPRKWVTRPRFCALTCLPALLLLPSHFAVRSLTLRPTLSPHPLTFIQLPSCHLSKNPISSHPYINLPTELSRLLMYNRRDTIIWKLLEGVSVLLTLPPAHCALKVKVPTRSLSGFLIMSLLAGFRLRGLELLPWQAISQNKTVAIPPPPSIS